MNDPKIQSADQTATDQSGVEREAPIRLGFTRGVSPSKWAERWHRAVPERALELVPIPRQYGRSASDDARSCDMVIERVAPRARPVTHGDDGIRTHHSMLLYEETVALVVAKDHELAEQAEIHVDELALVKLLDYPNHAAGWPEAEPWADAAWMPKNLAAALKLVATGLGAILAPLPLAKHVSHRREHAILRVVGDNKHGQPLPGTTIWATWPAEHDSADLQQLAGIMRGRTARSSRREPSPSDARVTKKPPKQLPQQPAKKKASYKPNSRGAQLAAVREKAARNKAAKAAAKRKRR